MSLSTMKRCIECDELPGAKRQKMSGLDMLSFVTKNVEQKHYRFACPLCTFDQKQNWKNTKHCSGCYCFVCEVPMSNCCESYKHAQAKNNKVWEVKKFWQPRYPLKLVASTKEHMLLWKKTNLLKDTSHQDAVLYNFKSAGIVDRLIVLDARLAIGDTKQRRLWLQTFCLTRLQAKKPGLRGNAIMCLRKYATLIDAKNNDTSLKLCHIVDFFKFQDFAPSATLLDRFKEALAKLSKAFKEVLRRIFDERVKLISLQGLQKRGEKRFIHSLHKSNSAEAPVLMFCQAHLQRLKRTNHQDTEFSDLLLKCVMSKSMSTTAGYLGAGRSLSDKDRSDMLSIHKGWKIILNKVKDKEKWKRANRPNLLRMLDDSSMYEL